MELLATRLPLCANIDFLGSYSVSVHLIFEKLYNLHAI